MTPSTPVEQTPELTQEKVDSIFSDIVGLESAPSAPIAPEQAPAENSEGLSNGAPVQPEVASTQIAVTEADAEPSQVAPEVMPEPPQTESETLPSAEVEPTASASETDASPEFESEQEAPALSDEDIVNQAVAESVEQQTAEPTAHNPEKVEALAWILKENPITDEYGTWTAADVAYIEQKLAVDKAESSKIIEAFDAAVAEAGNKLEIALRGLQGFDDRSLDKSTIYELAEGIGSEAVSEVDSLLASEDTTVKQIFDLYRQFYLNKHVTAQARYASVLEGFLEQVKRGEAPGQSKKAA